MPTSTFWNDADYLALKAANDQLRERGKAWFWESLNLLCAEINRDLSGGSELLVLQTGRQEWQFNIEHSVMVGERFGVRYQGKTLIFELGWPREPKHGFVPDQGLARGRVSLSLSPILDTQLMDDLILKAGNSSEAFWYVIRNHQLAEQITLTKLRAYLEMIIKSEI